MKVLFQTVIILFAWVSCAYAVPFRLPIPDGISIHSYAMDDSYIFAGAPGVTVGENASQGAVLVFERTGDNTWEHTSTLHASDGDQSDYFGYSLAYNGSGTLIVGAYGAEYEGYNRGAIYKFNLSGGHWGSGTKYGNENCSSSAHFGVSVDCFQDTIIVGAPRHYYGGRLGMVTIMNMSNGDVLRTHTGNPSTVFGFTGSNLGKDVGIYGKYAVASAPGDKNSGSREGRVWVFDESIEDSEGNPYGIAQYLENPVSTSEYLYFGRKVALSHVTRDLLVGDCDESSEADFAGVVHHFYLNPISEKWELRESYRGEARTDYAFGAAIAISGDTALIGAPGYRNLPYMGAVYRYKHGGGWSYKDMLVDVTGTANPGFGGGNICISDDYYLIDEIVCKKTDDMSPHFVSPGDVNDSGAVNLTDAVLALQALAGMETAEEVSDAADFNGDGMIGLAEVMYIFQVIRASK